MKTYVMSLRPLEICYSFQRGDRFYMSEYDLCRRQILTYKNVCTHLTPMYKNGPSTERAKFLLRRNWHILNKML